MKLNSQMHALGFLSHLDITEYGSGKHKKLFKLSSTQFSGTRSVVKPRRAVTVFIKGRGTVVCTQKSRQTQGSQPDNNDIFQSKEPMSLPGDAEEVWKEDGVKWQIPFEWGDNPELFPRGKMKPSFRWWSKCCLSFTTALTSPFSQRSLASLFAISGLCCANSFPPAQSNPLTRQSHTAAVGRGLINTVKNKIKKKCQATAEWRVWSV